MWKEATRIAAECVMVIEKCPHTHTHTHTHSQSKVRGASECCGTVIIFREQRSVSRLLCSILPPSERLAKLNPETKMQTAVSTRQKQLFFSRIIRPISIINSTMWIGYGRSLCCSRDKLVGRIDDRRTERYIKMRSSLGDTHIHVFNRGATTF
jgi:hypothetical protein